MAVRRVLLLGNPRLYEIAAPVVEAELGQIDGLVVDLHDTLLDFRSEYGAGRAIAAPQIGVMKRIIYMYIDRPVLFLNPVLERTSAQMRPVWDDCMCFPELLVKVFRHNSCRITFRNRHWKEESLQLEGDLSELLQHECDHLDGVLAVSKAIDGRSFALRSQRALLK